MPTHVYLRNAKELARALHGHFHKVDHVCREAMIKTAQFGVPAVQRTIRQTDPKPIASGTYTQSLSYEPTKTGAVLGFSARHAIFVEVGRRPGKRPPVAAILEWVRLKGLGKPKKRTKRSKASDLDAAQRSLAETIAWKIAHRGIKKRLVMERTMPAIQKQAYRELQLAVKRAIASGNLP